MRHLEHASSLYLPHLRVDDRQSVHGAHDPLKEIPMAQKIETKPKALSLEVEELEVICNPGCGTSTTSHKCTCPISITTTGSLFTARATN
jgi:hypothetical protein